MVGKADSEKVLADNEQMKKIKGINVYVNDTCKDKKQDV